MKIIDVNLYTRKLVPESEEDLNILDDIIDYFGILDESLVHTYKYKEGIIDGKKYFVKKSGVFLWGLKNKIINYMNSKHYEFLDETESIETQVDDLEDHIKNLKLPFTPYDYQIEGAREILESKRRVILSPTGSGKSCIIYIAITYLLSKGKKGIIVVPTTSLVDQLYNDFYEYSHDYQDQVQEKLNETPNDLRLRKLNDLITRTRREYLQGEFQDVFSKIYSGEEKFTNHRCKISTWQSIYDIEDEDFFDVDFVIMDEAHAATSESFYKITSKLSDRCEYRIGLTGTIHPELINQLSLEGLIGPAKRIVSIRQLVELGLVTDVVIQPIHLQYQEEDILYVKKGDPSPGKKKSKWIWENEWIRNNQKRAEFIAKAVKKISQSGNTIVLFRNIDQGKLLYEEISKIHDNVVYIAGDISKKKREEVRQKVDSHEDLVILGSLQIMSTGINIKSLRNVVFAQIGKAQIATIQSIGRAMRLYEGKTKSVIWDIIDDLRYYSRTNREYPNYYWKHALERQEAYAIYEYNVLSPKKVSMSITSN